MRQEVEEMRKRENEERKAYVDEATKKKFEQVWNLFFRFSLLRNLCLRHLHYHWYFLRIWKALD